MGRPRWALHGTSLLIALTPRLVAASHSARTLFIVGSALVVIAVIAIVLGVWGGRRRK